MRKNTLHAYDGHRAPSPQEAFAASHLSQQIHRHKTVPNSLTMMRTPYTQGRAPCVRCADWTFISFVECTLEQRLNCMPPQSDIRDGHTWHHSRQISIQTTIRKCELKHAPCSECNSVDAACVSHEVSPIRAARQMRQYAQLVSTGGCQNDFE